MLRYGVQDDVVRHVVAWCSGLFRLDILAIVVSRSQKGLKNCELEMVERGEKIEEKKR